MPASITQGTNTIGFTYGPERRRVTQTAPEGTALYLDAFGVHVELFGSGSTSQWTSI